MIRTWCWTVVALLFAVSANAAQAASPTVSLSGSSAAMKSSGSSTLKTIGYVGTYITVPPGGATIQLDVNASQGKGAGATHLNVVIADTTLGLSLGATASTNYTAGTVTLPAGTYAIRVERDFNNSWTSTRPATINKLNVTTLAGSQVKFSNSNSNANALAAANTYIQNFRQGNVSLNLAGVAAGTPVQIHMKRNAFNFGTAVAGANQYTWDSFMNLDNPNPAAQVYRDHLTATVPGTHVKMFNTISPENAGKWEYHEPGKTQPAAPNLEYFEDILTVAEQNDLTVRMHNLFWNSKAQQPDWVDSLIASANSGSAASRAAARTALSNAIVNRIKYIVQDYGTRFSEMDVVNEALRAGGFMKIYGAAGVASIYNEVAAVAAAAGNPNLKLFTNEYDVLQNVAPSSPYDAYANWYSQKEIQALRGAGAAVTGIGVQYYVKSTSGSNAHSPARIMQVMQNLSVHGLPIALTEFGVLSGSAGVKNAPMYLEQAMRMMYGTPNATDFLSWGFWGGDMWSAANAGALWDKNWNMTYAGATWQRLLGEWSTTLDNLSVDSSGLINFNGYYGDYEVIVGDQTFDLSLIKGTNQYYLDVASELMIDPPPEFLTALDSSSLVVVPEPPTLLLVSAAVTLVCLWQMCRGRRAV